MATGDGKGSKGGQNALDKLQEMIDSAIERKFGEQEQRDKESKDPWARMQGMIDRAVDKAVGRRFDLFAKGLEGEEEAGEDDKDGGEGPKLGILGL